MLFVCFVLTARPKLVTQPKPEETIDVGGSVSLQCKVDSGGLRLLTPRWYRNGVPAQERYELKIA